MNKPITAILFGAGARGADAYGPYAVKHPDALRFVAVAEPDDLRRNKFAAAHNIPADRCFTTWEDALTAKILADAVFNCTQDQMHYASAKGALEAGYHMLLEKPICNTLEETVDLVETAERHNRVMQICHVLRYTGFFSKVQEIIQSGRLGQVMTISHRENVSSWHMAHSFVRGNWRREETSSPMILAKCCHDLDLLYWFMGEPVRYLSSVGGLRHFKAENAPEGAPLRCIDGCPVGETCAFNAVAIYQDIRMIKQIAIRSKNPLERLAGNLAVNAPGLLEPIARVVPTLQRLTEYDEWPLSVITNDPKDKKAVEKALREGPYGRCVYHCDNDVVDHQVVTMEFESGVTATLTMHGHSHEEGRTMRVDGSQATMLAKFTYSGGYIEIKDHANMTTENVVLDEQGENSGHGGGDFGVVSGFLNALNGESAPLTCARDSLESHLMAFAAETARHEKRVIDMGKFRESSAGRN